VSGEKKSWLVRVKATIIKEVVCDDCTEAQAESDPFEHAIDERELEQWDYTVESVKENR
jgi:hypothetical protein